MKIIQQDFKVTSKILFIIAFVFSIGLLSSFFENNNDSIIKLLLNLITSIGSSLFCAYFAYHCSFTYEFKQKEIISSSLFTFWKKKSYEFHYLKKIEYSISPQGSIDGINLYFESKEYKKQISISKLQVDLSKVRLFLYANIENFEELVEEKQRRFA